MATLMVKYADPSEYALIDITAVEFEVIGSALREYQDFICRLGGEESKEAKATETLIEALERRYADD
jgi:hypothetical protein